MTYQGQASCFLNSIHFENPEMQIATSPYRPDSVHIDARVLVCLLPPKAISLRSLMLEGIPEFYPSLAPHDLHIP